MDGKKQFTIMMKIKLPNGKTIRTGYGSKDCSQSPELVSDLLQKAGFQIKETATNKLWFLIKTKKTT